MTRVKKYIAWGILLLLCVVACSLVLYWRIRPVRYAVFAGYNKNEEIAPYVVTYLKGLDKVTDGIVYIADSPLKDGELEKLKGINIIYTKHERHNEYDWGSYKRGYVWLKENGYLRNADELVLANDSVYAPLTSFKPMFKKMAENKNISFWGNTISKYRFPHIQSYFMVFRKDVFNSEVFDKFFRGITHLKKHKDYVFDYEVPLTYELRLKGFFYQSYMPVVSMDFARDYNDNPCVYPLVYIKKYKNQFIKRKVFISPDENLLESLDEILEYLKNNYKKTYDDIKQS